ncbi:hypothetical protein BKA64DRAFT_651949 [Cadophora sp. MPI-SDFR-AT-0126]|nr:hypothetical protein BKA64DRAFT_651949 [Leotiomycetes sp. MPI-SDFR-AT-0126]
MRPIAVTTRRLIVFSRPSLPLRRILSLHACFIPHASSSSAHASIAHTISTSSLVRDNSYSEIYDTKEEDWARLVADECDTSNYAPDITCTVGTLAYRQSYSNCSDSKWAAFKEKFEALVMKRWTRDAEAGRDPRGMRHRWQVFWVEDEKLEGKSIADLREFVPIFQDFVRLETFITDVY